MKHKMTLAEYVCDTLGAVQEGDTIEIIAKKQVVDMDALSKTRIPLLFVEPGEPTYIGFLKYLGANGQYVDTDDYSWNKAIFDTSPDAWVSWGKHVSWYDGECPLPDGVEYEVTTRGKHTSVFTSWSQHMNHTDVIAFRITGLKEGWEYPK